MRVLVRVERPDGGVQRRHPVAQVGSERHVRAGHLASSSLLVTGGRRYLTISTETLASTGTGACGLVTLTRTSSTLGSSRTWVATSSATASISWCRRAVTSVTT